VTAEGVSAPAVCIDCGDPDPGMPPRCRECAMDDLVSYGTCRECLMWIIAESWVGPPPAQHRPGCSLTNEPEFTARTDEERARVRDRRLRGGP